MYFRFFILVPIASHFVVGESEFSYLFPVFLFSYDYRILATALFHTFSNNFLLWC